MRAVSAFRGRGITAVFCLWYGGRLLRLCSMVLGLFCFEIVPVIGCFGYPFSLVQVRVRFLLAMDYAMVLTDGCWLCTPSPFGYCSSVYLAPGRIRDPVSPDGSCYLIYSMCRTCSGFRGRLGSEVSGHWYTGLVAACSVHNAFNVSEVWEAFDAEILSSASPGAAP